MRERAAIGRWLAACLFASSVAAQQFAIDVRLAADPQGLGPAAWTWTRRTILPRLPVWPERLDPLTAFDIRVVLPESISITPAEGATGELYSSCTLTVGGRTIVRGECAQDGRERWSVVAGAEARLPARFLDLVGILGCSTDTGPIGFDVAALAGNLMAAAVESDAESQLLTFGARECGTVWFSARSTAGGTEVVGHSGGGLLLPAAIAFLADRQRFTRDDSAALASRQPTELERWLITAAAAEFEEREEAARQLGRFDDQRARRTLEKLLFSGGRLRPVAMASIARSGAIESTQRLIEATDPKDGEQIAILRVALGAWWPTMPTTERERVLRQLSRHAAPEIRDLAGPLRGAGARRRGAAQSPAAESPPRISRALGPVLGGGSLLLLGVASLAFALRTGSDALSSRRN